MTSLAALPLRNAATSASAHRLLQQDCSAALLSLVNLRCTGMQNAMTRLYSTASMQRRSVAHSALASNLSSLSNHRLILNSSLNPIHNPPSIAMQQQPHRQMSSKKSKHKRKSGATPAAAAIDPDSDDTTPVIKLNKHQLKEQDAKQRQQLASFKGKKHSSAKFPPHLQQMVNDAVEKLQSSGITSNMAESVVHASALKNPQTLTDLMQNAVRLATQQVAAQKGTSKAWSKKQYEQEQQAKDNGADDSKDSKRKDQQPKEQVRDPSMPVVPATLAVSGRRFNEFIVVPNTAMLIDSKGVRLGQKTKAEILAIAKQQNMPVQQMTKDGAEMVVCKLIAPQVAAKVMPPSGAGAAAAAVNAQTAAQPAALNVKIKHKNPHEFPVRVACSDWDLGIKCNFAKKAIEKGHPVNFKQLPTRTVVTQQQWREFVSKIDVILHLHARRESMSQQLACYVPLNDKEVNAIKQSDEAKALKKRAKENKQ